jgi:hypothetical protein
MKEDGTISDDDTYSDSAFEEVLNGMQCSFGQLIHTLNNPIGLEPIGKYRQLSPFTLHILTYAPDFGPNPVCGTCGQPTLSFFTPPSVQSDISQGDTYNHVAVTGH